MIRFSMKNARKGIVLMNIKYIIIKERKKERKKDKEFCPVKGFSFVCFFGEFNMQIMGRLCHA